MKYIISLLQAFQVAVSARAQEAETARHRPQIRGAIMMANSHVPKATESGKEVLAIPTWGFDIDYFFHPRWSVAIQGDIKLQDFDIEENQVLLERSFRSRLQGLFTIMRCTMVILLRARL